jgi:hypothetical protein
MCTLIEKPHNCSLLAADSTGKRVESYLAELENQYNFESRVKAFLNSAFSYLRLRDGDFPDF